MGLITDIIANIKKLKKERDAIILAHYYVEGKVQDIADYVGDSYYLSKIATQISCKTILFCGVRFMGESAKILNPQKKIVMPDLMADCPLAHMIDEENIKRVKADYDDLAVVCYINSTAKIKALSDVCVTSANAYGIVKALPQKNIFFIPDNNLGSYLATILPEKHFVPHNGYCHVHAGIAKTDMEKALRDHAGAKILVHPECNLEVIEMADYVGSTSGIIEYATKSPAQTFIIGTECGVLHQLKKKNPDKNFFFADKTPLCPDMKLITLEKIETALQAMENLIEMDEELRKSAEKPLKKMLEMAK